MRWPFDLLYFPYIFVYPREGDTYNELQGLSCVFVPFKMAILPCVVPIQFLSAVLWSLFLVEFAFSS